MMRDELRESLALLPRRSDPWIWIAKPSESSVQKFIRRRSAPARALPVEGPAKDQVRRTVLVGRQSPQPVVNQRGFAHAGPGHDADHVDLRIGPGRVQERQVLLTPKNI